MSEAEKILNPSRDIFVVFGALMNDPMLLRDPSKNIKLSKKDFPQKFHQIMFAAINNLSYSDKEVKEITAVDIDNYLSSYPPLYKEWDLHSGMEYANDCKENSNKGTMKFSYDRLKKMTLLRSLIENQIDITDIFNYKDGDLKDIKEGQEKIDSMTESEIIEHYSNKVLSVKDEWATDEGLIKDFKADDGIDDLLRKLQETPEMGYPFKNGIYNTLFRGMRPGKFLLRSGGTGTGKTRQAIKDVVNIACDEVYEAGLGWKKLPPSFPALMISTELDKDELQGIILAYLTGIPDTEIKNGNYDKGTLDRLTHGIEVLKRSQLYFVYVDDFTISDIEMKIEQYILKHEVRYVAFDYLQITPKLSRSVQETFGTDMREDQILVNFSASMKKIAEKYDVFIESSTQLNRGSKEYENRDASALRGGIATADKVDAGVLCFKATDQDRKLVSSAARAKGIDVDQISFSHWVYKNRSGIDHVVIWTKMNLGNIREEVLFVTDYDFNLIDVKSTEVEFIEEKPAYEDIPVF